MINTASSHPSWLGVVYNETLPGHPLLRPARLVGESYEWIFSEIEDEGCDAVVTVICRIVLFFVLPIISIISVLFIPLGLLTNWVACDFTATLPIKEPKVLENNDDPLAPLGIPVSRPIRPTVSNNTPSQNLLQREIQYAMDTLHQVAEILDSIDLSKPDLELLENAKGLLEDMQMRRLLCEIPNKTVVKDPVSEYAEKYFSIEGRLRSIYEQVHLYRIKLCDNGELVAKENGDCLFESVLSALMEGVPTEERVLQERKETVAWMFQNYGEDKVLQMYLNESLQDFYYTLERKYDDEKASLSSFRGASSEQDAQRQAQIETLNYMLEVLRTDYLSALDATFVEDPSSDDEPPSDPSAPFNFEPIAKLVPYYLEYMMQKGEFGGAAELYALSRRHQVCVKVFAKNRQGIQGTPHPIMNPEYESTERPAIHLTHDQLHYNSYFPTAIPLEINS